MEEKNTNKGPEKKFRLGPISATIWKAKEGTGSGLLTVFEKSYKDKEGNWATTNHLTARDLVAIAWLAQKALDYVAADSPTPQ